MSNWEAGNLKVSRIRTVQKWAGNDFQFKCSVIANCNLAVLNQLC